MNFGGLLFGFPAQTFSGEFFNYREPDEMTAGWNSRAATPPLVD
jgi:hypothetical protein